MSNYNILKTNIAAQIKQNGAKAITGQILQTHLLSMITSLGAGYQYMGVAALNTNPGTPDYKCFYIATAVGTYSNFGSPALTVAQGEVAIFYYDTAWHKAVTGAASKADVDALIQTLEGEVSELGQEVSEKLEALEAEILTPGKNIFDKSKVCQGYLFPDTAIGSSRDPYTSGTYCNTPPIEVVGGQYLMINKTAGTTGAWNIQYDANGNIVTATYSHQNYVPILLNANTKFIRLSLIYAEIDTIQVEYGQTATAYEPFQLSVREELLEAPVVKIVEDNIKIPTFTKYPLGKNLFNKANVRQGFLSSASEAMSDGTPYTSGTYCSTNLIPVIGGRWVAINKNSGTSNVYTIAYAEDGTIVFSCNNGPANFRFFLPETARYLRTSFYYADLDSYQIEYNIGISNYEAYIGGDKLTYDQIYERKIAAVAESAIFRERFICPKMFLAAGKTSRWYFQQMISALRNDPVHFRMVVQSGLEMYDRFVQLNMTGTKNLIYDVCKWQQVIEQSEVSVKFVAAPSSAKSVSALCIGDSMTDMGEYQFWLKSILADDNITINYIGTSGGEKTHGSTTYDILHEALSGGNLSFISESKGNAYIVSVSGLTAIPKTTYPSAKYKDANNVVWNVRGCKLTQSGGTYSGYLVLGILNGTNTLPTSGTLTKTNSAPGDATISYTGATLIDFNPFWANNQIDFGAYLSRFGYSSPDVILLQFGYNEGQKYDGPRIFDDANTAISRAKSFIDAVHADYPNIKFVFGVEPYGAEIQKYNGGGENFAAGKETAIAIMRGMVDVFGGAAYSSFVYLVPVYGMMDAVCGYGPIVSRTLGPYNESIQVLQTGFDGVHPPYEYGTQEMGLAYEGVMREIANTL